MWKPPIGKIQGLTADNFHSPDISGLTFQASLLSLPSKCKNLHADPNGASKAPKGQHPSAQQASAPPWAFEKEGLCPV